MTMPLSSFLQTALEDRIYQVAQIRELERLAYADPDLSPGSLMDRAGSAAFEFFCERFALGRRVQVFCGGGNNGGDGYVFAKFAHLNGYVVQVWQVDHQSPTSEEAKAAYLACQQAGVPIQPFIPSWQFQSNDVLVDALCGIGVRGALQGDMALAIKTMNQAGLPILALDVPSGVQADTGQVEGEAILAAATITLIGLKLGLLTGKGMAHAGEVVCDALKLAPDSFAKVPYIASRCVWRKLFAYLPARPRDWHKGLSGHVVIIGGEQGFSGAPRMAALAALRVGAGLVTVGTRAVNVPMMNAVHPEIMCVDLEEEAAWPILLKKADVLVIGPGLGQSDWAKKIWAEAMTLSTPMVVDADALNLLSGMPRTNANWVLTPHPGEAARLLASTTAEVQADRVQAVKQICAQYGGVCVLKGNGSLIATKDHDAHQEKLYLCPEGNPGMATAGMGDILSGVIGGLIAQGMSVSLAATSGVCLHAAAGDVIAKQEGGRGMLATDLLPVLRQLVNGRVDD